MRLFGGIIHFCIFSDNGSLPALPAPAEKSLRDSYLKPGYEKPSKESGGSKLDLDLDGQ